jgi:hypothetical protein
MKTAKRDWDRLQVASCKSLIIKEKEPGRLVGTKYIPNRIFRGKVIEELRDAPKGLPLETIGRSICLDWSPREHRKWLKDILQKLQRDNLLSEKKDKYILAD